jgi:hypothetical protein
MFEILQSGSVSHSIPSEEFVNDCNRSAAMNCVDSVAEKY